MSSPFRRAIAPLFYRFVGVDLFAKRQWIESVATLDAARRREWQLTRLNALLEHCWANVPFYRRFWSDHGVHQRPLRSIEELGTFPVVSRETLQQNRDAAVATNLAAIPHKSGSTGGTTGAPLRYYHDLELHAVHYAYQLIGWGFAGYSFGDPVFVVSGGSLIPGRQKFRNRMRGWLEHKSGLYCLQMDGALARECHARMQEQGTKFIVGYPSTISLMLSSLEAAGLRVSGIKAVITTAEMLLPNYRRTIERLTGVPVFDHLGCNDGCFLSYECEQHLGFHYNDFEAHLEVTDPDEAGLGQLVITNLWNRSLPFIRYANGDLASLDSTPCDCGRKFPKIGRVRGRTADILSLANGKNLTGPGVTLLFKEVPVDAWQVVQVGPTALDIRLKAKERIPAAKEAELRRILNHHLGSEVVVTVNYPENLTVTSGGKLRPVFAEWKDPAGRSA